MLRRGAWLIGPFLTVAAGLAQPILPEGWKVEGRGEEMEGWWVAQEQVAVTAPLVSGTVTRLGLRLGALQRAAICRITAAGDKSLDLSLEARDEEYRVGLIGPEVISLPDSCVALQMRAPDGQVLFADEYFIRPHPHWYEGEDRRRVLAEWNQLPGATQHELVLKIQARGDSVGIWVDDRFVGKAEVPGFTSLRFILSPGNAVRGVRTRPLTVPSNFIPLGLQGYCRPSALQVGKPLLSPPSEGRGPGGGAPREVEVLDGVPFEMGAEGEEIDVGVSRWLAEKTGPEEFTDNYYTRSSFDSRPEDILLAVPSDDYSYAHVLCVVDPDPARTPVLTLRLTRFLQDYFDSGGRGAAIADSSMRMEKSGGRWPEGCQPVGRVKVKAAQGEKTWPLLHAAIPLKSGHIQEVLEEKGLFYGRSAQYLDLELTKELHLVETTSHGAYSTKPLGPPSGVHVLALTLERAPVKVRLRSRQIGNIFYASERPAFQVEMENRTSVPFEGRLSWQITDYYGQSREDGRTVMVPVQADGKPYRVRVDLHGPRYGWFRAHLALRDQKGRLVWEHPTSFALLPPDTRRAGLESPYGLWWFRESHIGSSSTDEMAPLLQRLGFRHVCPGGSGPDGAALARYGLGLSMYPDFVRSGEQGPRWLDEAVAKHPGVGWALIFHECGFGEDLLFPPEFLGRKPPPLTEEQQKKFQEWWDKALAFSQYCREKHPEVKLILGNSSLPFAVEFMRRGYPREYVDAFGDEDLGQAIMPEAPPGAFKSLYWLKEYAQLYHYEVPITSCYEWRGRGTNPGNLSELEQAQLYVRDVLQGLAYRMPHINPGLLHDVGDSYYYSRWGSGGLCHRYPLLNPKISYVALSTLTRELDQAVYQRPLDSGSPSLYAMEFAKEGGFVYALWLPRGERKVVLTFAQDTVFTLTDMNGNSQEVPTRKKRAEITASASPSYLRTEMAIQALRGGPTKGELAPAKRAIVDSLIDLSRWEVVREPDEQLDTCHFDFPRHLGKMDLQIVRDEQKQLALQVTLLPQPDLPWPVSRYVVLKAKTPLSPGVGREGRGEGCVPGKPTSVGLWVKGNSSWGRIFWEFQDAKGEKFFSIGAPCDGWSVGDWKSRTFLNFDGWNYLSVPLPFRYASGFYGPPEHHWTHTGGDGIVDYPIRFTRLVVELREKVVHLAEAVEVPDKSIRLRDLSVGYEPREG